MKWSSVRQPPFRRHETSLGEGACCWDWTAAPRPSKPSCSAWMASRLRWRAAERRPLARHPGFVEQDMDDLWRRAAETIRETLQRAGSSGAHNVVAVGVTGHGDGLYLADATGRPLGNGIQSVDSRAQAIAAEWAAAGTLDAVEAIHRTEALRLCRRNDAAGLDQAPSAGALRRHRPCDVLQGLAALQTDRRPRHRSNRRQHRIHRSAPAALRPGDTRAARARRRATGAAADPAKLRRDRRHLKGSRRGNRASCGNASLRRHARCHRQRGRARQSRARSPVGHRRHFQHQRDLV